MLKEAESWLSTICDPYDSEVLWSVKANVLVCFDYVYPRRGFGVLLKPLFVESGLSVLGFYDPLP
jgi:hypothetical protein